jgi:hypothetical protein
MKVFAGSIHEGWGSFKVLPYTFNLKKPTILAKMAFLIKI